MCIRCKRWHEKEIRNVTKISTRRSITKIKSGYFEHKNNYLPLSTLLLPTFCSKPSSEGISPDIIFIFILSVVRSPSNPISVGIGPVMRFSRNVSLLSFVSRPISVGMLPLILLPFNCMNTERHHSCLVQIRTERKNKTSLEK